MTTIKFRLHPRTLEPIAFIFDGDSKMAYCTIGQHSEFSMDFYEECIVAKPWQIRVFARELFRIGYEFEDVMAGISELKQIIKDEAEKEYLATRRQLADEFYYGRFK